MKLTAAQSQTIAASAFLVTGGAGFIGSHIAEFLLNAGARKVRVLDNMATGHFRNMASFANHPHFEFTEGDICNVETCRQACIGIDYVIQEATLGPISIPLQGPIIPGSIDASGFLNILVAAYEAKVKRFVYASDFGAAGSNDDTTTMQYIDEHYAALFTRMYGMETIGLRYFHVFGQRHHPQSVYAADIPRFVMQFMRHECPVIKGSYAYAHDFTYVENVVEANILAILTTNPQAVNQVYNIGVEEITSLEQLATYLKEYLSAFDGHIDTMSIPATRPVNEVARPADLIDKAKRLLGYKPAYSLQSGLLKSVSWYWAYLPLYNDERVEKKPHTRFSRVLTA